MIKTNLLHNKVQFLCLYLTFPFISCNFNNASTGVKRFISTASSKFLISSKVAECASKMLSCILGVDSFFRFSSRFIPSAPSLLSSSCFKISLARSISCWWHTSHTGYMNSKTMGAATGSQFTQENYFIANFFVSYMKVFYASQFILQFIQLVVVRGK